MPSFVVALVLLYVSMVLVDPSSAFAHQAPFGPLRRAASTLTCVSKSEVAAPSDVEAENNSRYIEGLIDNLTTMLDRWIVTGSAQLQARIGNVLNVVEAEAKDPELVNRAKRLITRAGLSLPRNPDSEKKNLGETDSIARQRQAKIRQQWESQRTSSTGGAVGKGVAGRSALSQRSASATDNILTDQIINPGVTPQKLADDKVEFEKALKEPGQDEAEAKLNDEAAAKVSAIVAKAGSDSSFQGESLGIGGLDAVLLEVKRRVWTPLAAPPRLLQELGIQPVRGLLLYGAPGCGKTLLARSLGKLLSPARPITVVSGPEVMDKFVGSSEKNLRAVFDDPPDVYDSFRIGEKDGGKAISSAALHVIVLDEFDAIARNRGGRGGSGEQGDAGVARDSVVNQLLAKMDGVDTLSVSTLVIGLTNKRSLIDSALLRPGRFEVQIEVPPPKTTEQRTSILQVHTKHMFENGRLLVRDAPPNSAAEQASLSDNPSYLELLERLAVLCDGFTGAALAGVARAAASRALERSVSNFSQNPQAGSLLESCIVVEEDFISAVEDVRNSGVGGDGDWAEDKTSEDTEVKDDDEMSKAE